MTDDIEKLRDELMALREELDALLRWKQWTLVCEMVLWMSRTMSPDDWKRASAWQLALTRYGDRMRALRQQAGATLGDVQDKLGISPDRLSGVERGREPPFDETTTRRLCSVIGADPQPLIEAAAEATRVMIELAGGAGP